LKFWKYGFGEGDGANQFGIIVRKIKAYYKEPMAGSRRGKAVWIGHVLGGGSAF
jgi:hypothetical protein